MNAEYRAAASRVFARTALDPVEGCLRIEGNLDEDGYARASVQGVRKGSVRAHRVVYVATTGEPIPPGMDLDHLCHTNSSDCVGGAECAHRRCVNPAHLEPVTRAENGQRQWSARKDICANGHQYDETNTYVRPNGRRDCRACIRRRVRTYQERRTLRAASVPSERAA